jgi:hypothetical protein
VKLQALMSTRSSKKWDPGVTRGPSAAAAKRRGVASSLVTKGATSGGIAASTAGERGPRAANASLCARSMLLMGRGDDISTTRGDATAGATRRQIPKDWSAEALGVVRFSSHCTNTARRRGPPAPVALTAATFGFFLLPRGCPRRFLPAADEPVAVEAEDESMAPGFFSFTVE